MRVVLGIDAAWTATRPSGVALAVERSDGWHLLVAATSYWHFHNLAEHGRPIAPSPSSTLPDARALLATASALCDGAVDLVAIDMPLARSPIVGRRKSDNAVSIAYGGRKCGTHSPSACRPGKISTTLRKDFERIGYPLRTEIPLLPGVIEVYPHPALVELTGAHERLPYKASKVRNYWPSASPSERRDRLYRQWHEIAILLEGKIAGVAEALPKLKADATGFELKAYEDALDAVICVWIAICAIEGRAMPFGDDNSAIWIPSFAVASISSSVE
jgi:predicted RNase H-like nuclease